MPNPTHDLILRVTLAVAAVVLGLNGEAVEAVFALLGALVPTPGMRGRADDDAGKRLVRRIARNQPDQ